MNGINADGEVKSTIRWSVTNCQENMTNKGSGVVKIRSNPRDKPNQRNVGYIKLFPPPTYPSDFLQRQQLSQSSILNSYLDKIN